MAIEQLIRRYFYTYPILHKKLIKKLKSKDTDLSKWIRRKSREEIAKKK